MPWIEPKTDWKAEYDSVGVYLGDFFNIEDYNRIKNNLQYIRDRGSELFSGLPNLNLGADKHFPILESPDFNNDNIFADEINAIEDGLKAIDDVIGLFRHGEKKQFYENGAFIDFAELNRIEKAELHLHDVIEDSIAGKKRLAIRFGERGNTIRP